MSRIASSIRNCPLSETQTGIWYLGQEGILLKHKGRYLLVDPYLSDYVDRHCSQIVPWKRRYPAPIRPEEVDFADIILCTHSHADHADPDTLVPMLQASPKAKLMVPAPEVPILLDYGMDPQRIIPARADQSITLAGFTIRPIPAAHECFHTDEAGDYREMSYVIHTDSGVFFHGGDLCVYDELPARIGPVDVAFLPINGRDYFRTAQGIIGNLNSEEAVLLAKEIKAGLLIPMHHELYQVNGAPLSGFVDALARLNPDQCFHCFTPGERYLFMRD